MTRQIDIKAIISHIVRGDGLDKCRICMGSTREGQVFLGDTVMKDGGKSVTLAEILLSITGLQMQLEKCLPTGICSTCLHAALNAAAFRNVCLQAYKKWNTLIELLVNLKPENTTKTQLCAIIDDNKITIVQDSQNFMYQKTNEKEVSSLLCRKSTYTCPDCKKKCKYPQQIFNHLKDSTDFKRACYVCGDIMLRHKLVTHLKRMHNINALFCNKCSAIFSSQDEFDSHVAKFHIKGNECIDCGQTFQSDKALHAHMSLHTRKICPNCDKQFLNQKCYFHHFKHCIVKKSPDIRKVGIRGRVYSKYICDYCGKTFAHKKIISAHMKIVHMKNTHHPCKICGKLFAAAHMSEHLKSHVLEHPFKCEQCGMVFKSRLGYRQHLRLHSGERPYPCSFCNERFSTSSRRSEHIQKIHKIILLNHRCSFCPAKFRLRCQLRRHLLNVHSNQFIQEMKYKCMICNKWLSTSRGLDHHSRTHQKVSLKKK